MARKTLVTCDGCGKEHKSGSYSRGPDFVGAVQVDIVTVGRTKKEYDLYDNCLARLKEVSNPKTWPRKASDAGS